MRDERYTRNKRKSAFIWESRWMSPTLTRWCVTSANNIYSDCQEDFNTTHNMSDIPEWSLLPIIRLNKSNKLHTIYSLVHNIYSTLDAHYIDHIPYMPHTVHFNMMNTKQYIYTKYSKLQCIYSILQTHTIYKIHTLHHTLYINYTVYILFTI